MTIPSVQLECAPCPLPAPSDSGALPPQASEETGARRPGRFTASFFVAALAFLLASFPAQNSDVWLHLAAGKHFVQEPFSAAADSPLTATWLYDVISYGLYTTLGDFGLVLTKAVLVAVLALVLLRLSQTGSWFNAVSCTTLAVLAMSIRLPLQPATVSCVLLGLLLVLNSDDTRGRSAARGALRRAAMLPRWPLLVLFVIWANLDPAFVLGLGTVGLLRLGRNLDENSGGIKGIAGALGTAAVFLGILAAVCLINPANLRAFALYLQEMAASSAAGPRHVTSPFGHDYLLLLGTSPATLAYYPLLGLGALSFTWLALRSARRHAAGTERGAPSAAPSTPERSTATPCWSWQRFLPWLGLAALSALQARTIPFFAVVAGPVLAWNLHTLWLLHSAERRRRDAPSLALRTLGAEAVVCLGLILLVCAWAGWLQAPPFEPRRWSLEAAPSLVQGAAVVKSWYEQGRFGPSSRGLHLSAASAQVFAWLCPEDRALEVSDLARAARASAPDAEKMSQAMRSAGIDHLIVYDPDRTRLFAALYQLLPDPQQWPLLVVEGELAVFGWRDPARPEARARFRGQELDWNRLAFRPEEDELAPPRRTQEEVEPRRWWEALWKQAPPLTADRQKATVYWFYADAMHKTAPRRHQAAWEVTQAAALVGAGANWPGVNGPVDALRGLAWLRPQPPERRAAFTPLSPLDKSALLMMKRFVHQRDDIPPALLYLAVRAARRALVHNPQDAHAYLILGGCYLRFLEATRERAWGEKMPAFIQLRETQAVTALHQALALRPDLGLAHFYLAGLYQKKNYLDLALSHLRSYQKLAAQAATPQGAQADDGKEDELMRLAGMVEVRQGVYRQEATGVRVLDRARIALKRGLAGKARDLLLESDVSAFGVPGILSELELLLGTGRAHDVVEWTAVEGQQQAMKAEMGNFYYWLRAAGLAALGDYTLADEELTQLALDGRDPKSSPSLRSLLALAVARSLLNEQFDARSVPEVLWQGRMRVDSNGVVHDLIRRMKQEADACVLRGLLALERGNIAEARAHFLLALDFWRGEQAAGQRTDRAATGVEFSGRTVAQDCLLLLK